MTFWIYLKYLG